MKKSILLLSVLAMGGGLYAQQDQGRVGINTPNPKATLDISKEGVDDAKGLLIPRLKADEVKKMTDANKIGEDQNSLLLYVTEPFADSTNKAGKYELIDQAGYYYYDAKDNGGKWKKLDTTLYGSNGTLSDNRTVTMDGKTLTFKGTEQNKAKIQVPHIEERTASEEISGVVMANDGTLKRDSWWRLGDGSINTSLINEQSVIYTTQGIIKYDTENKRWKMKTTITVGCDGSGKISPPANSANWPTMKMVKAFVGVSKTNLISELEKINLETNAIRFVFGPNYCKEGDECAQNFFESFSFPVGPYVNHKTATWTYGGESEYFTKSKEQLSVGIDFYDDYKVMALWASETLGLKCPEGADAFDTGWGGLVEDNVIAIKY
ncbi:hypothetical protein ACQ1P2_07900 [Ornithobacterium rhinotracheale]|uniref:hypothetical protein n=2 Tax=Ornithobacterium rhinotracheale TaxID=28251 RepID=UPI0039FCE225